MNLVIVEWLDAHFDSEEIAASDVVEKMHFGYRTESCGYLIKQDEIGITIACDIQRGPEGEVHYRLTNFIPKGMIVSVRTVPIPGPKKRKGS